MLLAVGGVQVLRSLASPNAQGPFLISFGGAMIPRLHEVVVDRTNARDRRRAVSVHGARDQRSSGVETLTDRSRSGDGRPGRGGRAVHAATLACATCSWPVRWQRRLCCLSGRGCWSTASAGSHVWIRAGTPRGCSRSTWSPLRNTRHHGRRMLIDELLVELRRTPGVQGAGFTYAGPLLGLIDHVGVFVPPGRTPEEMRGIPDGPSNPLGQPRLPPDHGGALTGWPLAGAA